jgi:hypothetical protein
MNTLKKVLTSAGLFLTPALAFAQINIGSNVSDLKDNIQGIFDLLAPILIAVVVIYLLYGAFLFALAGGDDDKKKKGKDILLYGLIGVFLIVSIIGLINFVIGSINFAGGNNPINSPVFP